MQIKFYRNIYFITDNLHYIALFNFID